MKRELAFVFFGVVCCAVLAAEVAGPVCGNGVLEPDEFCEQLGSGDCNENCRCAKDKAATEPASEFCLPPGKTNLTKLINCSATAPTFACIEGIMEKFLVCSSASIFFLDCPPGTVCQQQTATQRTSPCRVPGSNYSRCGNGIVEPGEDCEQGGELCDDANCLCVEGAQPTTPRTSSCTNGSMVPVCGNGIVEESEQCEAGGANCFETNCTCRPGFSPTTPRSQQCFPAFMANLDQICDRFTGFVCIENVTTQFLQCQSGKPDFFQCPVGSVCRNTTVQQENPCEVINASVPICGNGVVEDGEQCEVGGFSCANNCTCEAGFAPTTPRSIHCAPPDEADLFGVCGNNTKGFLCVTGLDRQYLSCEQGSVGLRECPPETSGCSVGKNVTTFNPCVPSTRRLCGNGRIDEGEQCDGGKGCADNCTCMGSLVPTNPPSPSCTTCGNGEIDSEEQCDSGVGCTSSCTCSSNFSVSDPPSIDCSLCGNRAIDPEEECDSGANCLGNCSCASGFEPTVPPSANCTPICGNGRIDPGEQCDFGGANCTENCSCGPGSQPEDPPAVDCVVVNNTSASKVRAVEKMSICGDQVLEAGEECEAGGIGCDDSCRCLEGFKPATPPAIDCDFAEGGFWWF